VSSGPDVLVVGAGVVGLTCAVALREAGMQVEVVGRDAPLVSEVAGGLWLPYATGTDDRTLGWARATYAWLEQQGAPMTDYVHVEDGPDPWWLAAVPAGRARRAQAHEVPAGRRGWVARVPLVPMPRHLEALRRRAGAIVHREVAALEDLPGIVVHCTGLGARALAGDDAVVPIRGQVVHVRPRTGATVPCIADEDEGTYVLPREDVCVVGGIHAEGDWDDAVRETETADILARAERLVPGLAGAEVLGVRAGLRPGRHGGVRLEREGDVVHCYGHGGAGVTLSWGCAQEVVRLVAAGAPAPADHPGGCPADRSSPSSSPSWSS
jgi:D-amino-acid oxidase